MSHINNVEYKHKIDFGLKTGKMIRTESKIVLEKEQENSFTAYATMEFLLDKLKLLNFEKEFLNEIKLKPIHKFVYQLLYTFNAVEFFL